jgi:23S rRNA pseudouridine1911/1915/1917 synthase
MNHKTEGMENEEELFEHHRFLVDAGQGAMRIDKFLNDRLTNISRNKIQEGMKEGLIHVNGHPVKSSYQIKPSDDVVVYMKEPKIKFEIIPQDIPLQVMYEDEILMVINKEPGMVVHPGHGNWEGTLVNALVHRLANLPTHRNGEIKPGLVHRIDKDTSGLILVAKTDEAMTLLAQQFADHTVDREYFALVWGEPKEDKGTITGHIARSTSDRKIYQVYPEGNQGKHAITHYEVIKRLRYVSLVRCKLETGRTHQIRVHMKYIGHTLFNDKTYGGDKILKGEKFSKYKAFVENCFELLPRQALHAKTLGFLHPLTRERVFFDSELPADIQAVIARWEHYVQYH